MPAPSIHPDPDQDNSPCLTLAERIGAFVDGELSTPEQTAIETHLSTCKACEQMAVEFRQLDALAARDKAPEVSPREWSDLWSAVRAEVIQSPRQLTPTPEPIRIWRWLAPSIAAAAILLGLGIGGIAGWFGGSKAPSTPVSRTPAAVLPSGEFAESVSGPKPVIFTEEDVHVIDYTSVEPRRP